LFEEPESPADAEPPDTDAEPPDVDADDEMDDGGEDELRPVVED
jgi:hypothetical protein